MSGPRFKVHTVADFAVGQKVIVRADQGFRVGEVTKLGRTQVRVHHPRNRQGTMVERPYPMHSIVLGQYKSAPSHYWRLIFADGHAYPWATRSVPGVPMVDAPIDLVAEVQASWDAGAEQWNYTWRCPCGATDKGALDDEDEAHAEADAHTASHQEA